jgi:dihydropteroate synthase
VIWQLRRGAPDLSRRGLIMGVLNVTPDSFSDGGNFDETETAIRHALALEGEGADIIDVGGESTRPGAEPVGEAEELRRVIPVIEAVRRASGVLVSIDTSKAAVAEAAVAAGADIINDVTALAGDGMPEVAAKSGAGVVLMHMQGEPRTMQKAPHYTDVV